MRDAAAAELTAPILARNIRASSTPFRSCWRGDGFRDDRPAHIGRSSGQVRSAAWNETHDHAMFRGIRAEVEDRCHARHIPESKIPSGQWRTCLDRRMFRDRRRASHAAGSPEGSLNGKPVLWTRMPGACPQMTMRAVEESTQTGLGSSGRGMPYRGASRHIRHALISDDKVSSIGGNSLKSHALALGRLDTASCQRRRLPSSSGICILASFKKSIDTSSVISAIENVIAGQELIRGELIIHNLHRMLRPSGGLLHPKPEFAEPPIRP